MMSDLIGTKVKRANGGGDQIGQVVESDNLERAKRKDERTLGANGKYTDMVAVQWYSEGGEEDQIGWHKKGALVVVEDE